MFTNWSDHYQCLSYRFAIASSELSEILKIPAIINKKIAEYSTGKITNCANTKCQAGICILESDMQDFRCLITLTNFNFCSIKNKYFCMKCEPSTTYFECCDTIQCVLECQICYYRYVLNNCTFMILIS